MRRTKMYYEWARGKDKVPGLDLTTIGSEGSQKLI